MKTLNVCPYDGRRLQVNNLAYELVFPEGWSWEKVREETVIGTERKLYISEKDSCVTLLENRAHGRNGIDLLCEHIDRSNRELFPLEFGTHSDSKKKLSYRIANGLYIFCDENGSEIMYAVPICPACHRRLPAGWLGGADDFLAVSIEGRLDEIKENFIESIAEYDYAEFKKFENVIGSKSVISADRYGIKCIDDADSHEAPVFIKAVIAEGNEQKTLIAGIYDSKSCFVDTSADIYLFDANVLNRTESNDAWSTDYVRCDVTPISNQGDFQKANNDKVISALELLNFTGRSSEKTGSQEIAFYNETISEKLLSSEGKLEDKQFIGVILNGDTLKNGETGWKYSPLLEVEDITDFTDINMVTGKTELVKEMIEAYKLFGNVVLDDMGREYGKGVIWNCIAKDKTGDELKLEPVITCLMRRICENGWL